MQENADAVVRQDVAVRGVEGAQRGHTRGGAAQQRRKGAIPEAGPPRSASHRREDRLDLVPGRRRAAAGAWRATLDPVAAAPPGMDRHTKQDLVSQTAAILDRSHSDGGSIEDEITRLYGIRSELVHDGSREILDSDSAEMYEIALAVTLGVLVSPEVKQVETLGALDALLQSWVNK